MTIYDLLIAYYVEREASKEIIFILSLTITYFSKNRALKINFY